MSEESKNNPGVDENGESDTSTEGCEEESDEGEPPENARLDKTGPNKSVQSEKKARINLPSLLSPLSKTITDDLEAALDKSPRAWLGLEFLVEHRFQCGEVGDEGDWQSPEKGEQAPEKEARAPGKEERVLEKEERAPENEEQALEKEEQVPQKEQQQEQCEQQQSNDRRRFDVYYVCHLCGNKNLKITIAKFAYHLLGTSHQRYYQRMVYPYFIAGEDTDISAEDVTEAAMRRKAPVINKNLKQIIGRQKIIRNEEFVNGGLPSYIKNGKLKSEVVWKLKVALKVRSDEVGFTDIFEAKMPKDEPMVGLEFITEKVDDQNNAVRYICHLCMQQQMQLPGKPMLHHIGTLKHWQNYKRVVEPQLEAFDPSIPRTKMEIKESILKWAIEHEAKMGRKSITRKEQLENGELPKNLRDKITNAAKINNVFDSSSVNFVNYYSITSPSEDSVPSSTEPIQVLSKEPIVGLEFITESHKDATSKIIYTCHLCFKILDHASDDSISHMIGFKHRLNYVIAVDPQSLMPLMQLQTQMLKKQWQIALNDLAKETCMVRGWKSVIKMANIKDGALPAHILEWREREGGIYCNKPSLHPRLEWKARLEQEDNLNPMKFGKGGKKKFVQMPKRMRLEPADPCVDLLSPTHHDGRGILGSPPSHLALHALSQEKKSIPPPSLPLPPFLERRSASLSLAPLHDERVRSSHPPGHEERIPHSHDVRNPAHPHHKKRSHPIGHEEKTHSYKAIMNFHYKEKSLHHQLYHHGGRDPPHHEERTPRPNSQEERARPHYVERDYHPHKESTHRQLYHDGRDHPSHHEHPPRHDERTHLHRLNHEARTTDRHRENRIAPPPHDRTETYHKQKTPYDDKSRYYYRERSPFPPPSGSQRESSSDRHHIDSNHHASPSNNCLASSDTNNSTALWLPRSSLSSSSLAQSSAITLDELSSLSSSQTKEAGSFSSTPSKHTGSETRMSSSLPLFSSTASGVTPSSSRNDGNMALSSTRVNGNMSFLSEAGTSVSSSTTTSETRVMKDLTISLKAAESMPLSAFEDILALVRTAEGLSSSNSSTLPIKDAPSSSRSAGCSSIPDSSSLVSKAIRDPPSSKSVGSTLLSSTMPYASRVAKDPPSSSKLTGSAGLTGRDLPSLHKSTNNTSFSTLSSKSAGNASLSTSFSTLSHAPSRDCSRDQRSSRAAKTTSSTSTPSSSSASSSWPSAPTVFIYEEGSAHSDTMVSTASTMTAMSRKTNYDQQQLNPPSQSTAPSSKFSNLMLAVMNQQPAAQSVDVPADGNPDNYATMNKPVDNRRTNYSLMNVRGSSVDQTDMANIPKRTDSPPCIYLD